MQLSERYGWQIARRRFTTVHTQPVDAGADD
jgi:hypothetical protein